MNVCIFQGKLDVDFASSRKKLGIPKVGKG